MFYWKNINEDFNALNSPLASLFVKRGEAPELVEGRGE